MLSRILCLIRIINLIPRNTWSVPSKILQLNSCKKIIFDFRLVHYMLYDIWYRILDKEIGYRIFLDIVLWNIDINWSQLDIYLNSIAINLFRIINHRLLLCFLDESRYPLQIFRTIIKHILLSNVYFDERIYHTQGSVYF